MNEKDTIIISSAELQKNLMKREKRKGLRKCQQLTLLKAVVQIHTAAWINHGKVHLTFLSR